MSLFILGACFESIQKVRIVLHFRNLQKFLLQKFHQGLTDTMHAKGTRLEVSGPVAKPFRLVGRGNRELLLQPPMTNEELFRAFLVTPKTEKKNVHEVQEGIYIRRSAFSFFLWEAKAFKQPRTRKFKVFKLCSIQYSC